MRYHVVVAVALTALFACKGKPTPHQKAEPAGSASSGGSSSMGAVVPGPGRGSEAAPDIVLPHSDGSPPKPTTAPITPETLTALSQLQFPGFLRDVRKVTNTSLEVKHKTDSRPRILATVFVEQCNGGCTPMELDAWKAKSDSLQAYLTPTLRALPDTKFEVGATTLDGAKAIYTFQLAQSFTRDADGNSTGAYSYAYVVYFNDGVNQIHVVAEYKDDPMTSAAAMTASVPREDLEKVAKSFADVYTHAW